MQLMLAVGVGGTVMRSGAPLAAGRWVTSAVAKQRGDASPSGPGRASMRLASMWLSLIHSFGLFAIRSMALVRQPFSTARCNAHAACCMRPVELHRPSEGGGTAGGMHFRCHALKLGQLVLPLGYAQ